MTAVEVERRVTLSGTIAALPDLLLGLVYLVAWVDPAVLPWASGRYLLGILMLEFVIIHTSGVMSLIYLSAGSRMARSISLIGLSLAFSGLILIMAHRFEADWMLIAFWFLTANKLLIVFLGEKSQEVRSGVVTESWVAAFLLYSGCVMISFMIPTPPALGATLESFPATLPAFQRWSTEPQRFLAAGFAYFMLLGLSEMTEFAWVKRAGAVVGSWSYFGVPRNR